MTQARRPPESRARDRLGRLRPPPAPPLGPREPVIRLSTERARAGQPGNCRFPLTRGACGRPESGGHERPVAGSSVITTRPALRGQEPWPQGPCSAGGTARRRRTQGGAGGVWGWRGPGCGRGQSVRCGGPGGLRHPFPFLDPAPTLTGALGLEPHCYGVECPSPNEGINLSLTIHGPLMLEGASVPPSVKLVNNSYR